MPIPRRFPLLPAVGLALGPILQSVGQTENAVTALDQFLAQLTRLAAMPRQSGGYRPAVQTLVAEERQKGH